jgi:hypothetical protein
MRLYGLMITKDDAAVFGDWCRDQLPLYDAVVCLDGSQTDATARIAAGFGGRFVYLHERDHALPHKTDHGLRGVVHRELVRRFGNDGWVMCCHADEFCYHDPRKVALRAEQAGCDAVAWFSLHFYPHPSEWADWPRRQSLPVQDRLRHYHWDYRGSGLPWVEDRLYHNGPDIAWDGITHGCVRPHGVKRVGSFHPILRHYKVVTTDLTCYASAGQRTFYRNHWDGAGQRTGLAFAVERVQDLFISATPDYARCDRFDGRFDHPWNIGDEYCPAPRHCQDEVQPRQGVASTGDKEEAPR